MVKKDEKHVRKCYFSFSPKLSPPLNLTPHLMVVHTLVQTNLPHVAL
jgi:hypothetical protein